VCVLCRRYAASIKGPYKVCYEPLTQSDNVLDNKEALRDITPDGDTLHQ